MIWEGFQQANESGKQRISATYSKAYLKVPEKLEKEILSTSIKQVTDFKGVNVSFVEYQPASPALFESQPSTSPYHFSPFFLQAAALKHMDTA